ncbi:MAG: hypothetical protein PHN64_03400 [Desulfovibrionaceae bacterium]|nr:hypothetical protein [Desulfovibrionaceae bacterium]
MPLSCCDAKDIRIGKDTAFDGWLFNILIDNNILHDMNPQLIGAPEQMRFMVVLEEDQVYLPCEDSILCNILSGTPTSAPATAASAASVAALDAMYNRAWRVIVRLVRQSSVDRDDARRRLTLCKHRFRQAIATRTVIPSRVVKRMIALAFFRHGLNELWEDRRSASCGRQQEMLTATTMQQMLHAVDRSELFGDMLDIQKRLHFLELARKMYLSCMSRPWLDSLPSVIDIQKGFAEAEQVSKPLELFFGNAASMTVLFLVDADGGFVLDMYFVEALIRMGHRVIVAVKQGFHFFSPTLMDVEADPNLAAWRDKAYIVHDPALGKNALLRLLREHKLLIISDGTQERMNLCRVSVSFARAWKECDLVIAKGWRNAGIFLKTSHAFTRDVLCYWMDTKNKQYHVEARPRPSSVRKFSETDLNMQAEKIIRTMRQAREAGKSVMFYSCVIGSIPGQTATASKLVKAFVENLRKKSDNIFIINPAEHFIEGMDGDDLMFMWERVQRSGLIDIWRFQSVEDIEESFALLGRKVPPIWVGKDATYSTGCTKEMRIAIDVQEKNREMQIIGPAPRLFFRRSEYGVGKYYDATIKTR